MTESLRTLNEDQFYRDGHLLVDFCRKTATLDSRMLMLTHKEYCILELLVQHAGRIVSRDMLLKQIWGSEEATQTRSLDVHIQRLRKKLGEHGRPYIQTIFGTGHRFEGLVNPHEETIAESPDHDHSGPACLTKNVTLPSLHWEWLDSQPGGASTALRALVERVKRAQTGR